MQADTRPCERALEHALNADAKVHIFATVLSSTATCAGAAVTAAAGAARSVQASREAFGSEVCEDGNRIHRHRALAPASSSSAAATAATAAETTAAGPAACPWAGIAEESGYLERRRRQRRCRRRRLMAISDAHVHT